MTHVYTIDQDIVAAVLRRVVGAAVAVHTPVTREG